MLNFFIAATPAKKARMRPAKKHKPIKVAPQKRDAVYMLDMVSLSDAVSDSTSKIAQPFLLLPATGLGV